MNIYQRIILILGAIALIIMIVTTPRVVVAQGSYLNPVGRTDRFIPVISLSTGVVRAIGVLGATCLLFFAFKDLGKKRE